MYTYVRGIWAKRFEKNNSDTTKTGMYESMRLTLPYLIFRFRGPGRRGGHGGPPQGGSCTQPRALRGPKGEGEAPSPLGIKR